MKQEKELPWEPLYTIHRSGIPEITLDGVISVWAGPKHGPLVSLGDVFSPLWTRSLLKPWQLLCLLPTLKAAYPALDITHLALMLSSHSGEAMHVDALTEMLAMADLEPSDVQCPNCYPLSNEVTTFMKAQGKEPFSLHHPCSGKHTAVLMALKAQKKSIEHYLSPDEPIYQTLRELIGLLLKIDPRTLEISVDGCGMPTLALSSLDISKLFYALTQELPPEIFKQASPEMKEMLAHWNELKKIMKSAPKMVGGTHRLDTRLMSGDIVGADKCQVYAKEGADGLLGVSFAPGKPFNDGLGLLIKLASGYDPKHMETILLALLEALGVHDFGAFKKPQDTLVTNHFYFQPMVQAGPLYDD